MNVYYAMAQEELDRFYAFRDMESRLRSELSPQLIAEVRAAVHEERDAEGSRPLYEVKDGAANISVSGTLTEKRHLSDDLYGDVTTYADIRRATIEADADPLVREIVYHVNSPGGTWDGADYTAETIKNAAKPTKAVVYTAAQSGGYFLASQADKIYAATRGSMAGSIGVAAEVFDRTMEDGQKGIKRYVLTNRDSPDKRPKAEEEEGRNIIIDRLDDLYAIFEQRAVEGRSKNVKGFSAETVRSLAGRTVTAEKALELGLIDGILSETAGGTPKTSAGGVNVMKLADFLAANPGAGEEIASYAVKELGMLPKAAVEKVKAELDAARSEAVQADRERVLELLDLSGVKISASLREAVADGADSGDFAKSRVKELNAALGASNAGSLGSPKAEQHLGDQIAPKGRTPEGAVTDEERLRGMAKKGGF